VPGGHGGGDLFQGEVTGLGIGDFVEAIEDPEELAAIPQGFARTVLAIRQIRGSGLFIEEAAQEILFPREIPGNPGGIADHFAGQETLKLEEDGEGCLGESIRGRRHEPEASSQKIRLVTVVFPAPGSPRTRTAVRGAAEGKSLVTGTRSWRRSRRSAL